MCCPILRAAEWALKLLKGRHATRPASQKHANVKMENVGFRGTLIVNAEAVYDADELLEATNILIAGGKIVGFPSDFEFDVLDKTFPSLDVIDAAGYVVAPGIVDMHVHILGGGGEGGPASRCPTARVSELFYNGITTAVGLVGTDNVSRLQDELIIKAREFSAYGLTTYTWIGSYHVPIKTCTGEIKKDLAVIETTLGIGEVAVSDHRGSQINAQDIMRLAAEARVGGMVGGKAGLLYIHMGRGHESLKPVREAVSESDVPISQFLPTHMEKYVDESISWIGMGGNVDVTAGDPDRACKALDSMKRRGADMANVTLSSDSYGSWPGFDKDGKMTSYKVVSAGVLAECIKTLRFQFEWDLKEIFPLLSKNPAERLKLHSKGRIKIGRDADVLFLNKDTLDIVHVLAKGVHVKGEKFVCGEMWAEGSYKECKIRPMMLEA